ncbi:hypothetical protein B7P43_G10209 [Cryptotermes secundus]|uniref:Mariner Mos1 transposase n=1 Tax=Cryptotermes secundus TaxID=105785 RepID=A0A2J7RDD4_9NEOP|nr:hypothetical protein B7P43_G10209 [Cryptotermes secundus]
MADFRKQRVAVKFCFLLWKSGTETLEFLPGPCPVRLFLFPRMNRDMKGKHFADVAEVKEKTTEALSSISKDEFRQCFEKWNKRLDKCISVSGEYFEGD